MFRGLNIVFEVLNDLQVVHNTISLIFFGFVKDYTKKLQNGVFIINNSFIFCLSVVFSSNKKHSLIVIFKQIILCTRQKI